MFRVGDEVVCIDAESDVGGLVKGATYVVSGVFRPGDFLPILGQRLLWRSVPENLGATAIWVAGGADFASAIMKANETCSPGYKSTRFSKVERKSDSLSIEAFLTIKPNQFESPKRTNQPAKRKEQA